MNMILAEYAYLAADRWRRITRGDGKWYMLPDTLRDVYLEGPGIGSVKPNADLATLPTAMEWSLMYVTPNPAEERDRIEREWAKKRDDWWIALRALPGGNDPLWIYSTHGEDAPDDAARDMDVRLGDESIGNANAWFPRLRLRIKYGTSSLMRFAEMNGLPYPTR